MTSLPINRSARLLTSAEIDRGAWTAEERAIIQQCKRWPSEELSATRELVLPDWLPRFYAGLLAVASSSTPA
jgi:hypothetical protein